MRRALTIAITIIATLGGNAQTADQFFEQGVAKGKAGDQLGAIEDFKKAMSLHPQLAVQIIERGLTMPDNGAKVAKIIAPNLVFLNDEYEAEIFLATYGSSKDMKVDLDGYNELSTASPSLVWKDGILNYSVKATHEGLQTFSGTIAEKSPSGRMLNYPFSGSYMVMKSGVVVSPTKMNVLYRGVRNPVSISVPGIAPDRVHVDAIGGTVRPDAREGKGNFIVEPTGGSEVIVKVSAETDGVIRPMGDFKFRVKEVPAPLATIAGVEEGLVSVARLAAAPTIIPKMQSFDFELYFQVTSFDLVYQVGTDLITKPVTGNKIPDSDLDLISRLEKGSRVLIENISAVMLDENNRPVQGITPKKLAPISLKLN